MALKKLFLFLVFVTVCNVTLRADNANFYLNNPSNACNPSCSGSLTMTVNATNGASYCTTTAWSYSGGTGNQIIGNTSCPLIHTDGVAGSGNTCNTPEQMASWSISGTGLNTGTQNQVHFSASGSFHGGEFNNSGLCDPPNTTSQFIPIQAGAPACSSDLTVTGHWDTVPYQGSAVVNVLVGGILLQITCDQGGCNSGTIPGAQYQAVNGSGAASLSYGTKVGSWDICIDSAGHFHNNFLSVSSSTGPASVSCGGSVNFTITSGCGLAPSPSPSASPVVPPSPSPSNTPAPTPIFTPPPQPTPPSNNPGTSVTNGGTVGDSISNQDIYNDVKQALDDAGNKDSTLGSGGIDGNFVFGNQTAAGEDGTAQANLTTAVNNANNALVTAETNGLNKISAIQPLNLPSAGNQGSIGVTLPVLGSFTVDFSPYDAYVGYFRGACLIALLISTWYLSIKIIRSGIA